MSGPLRFFGRLDKAAISGLQEHCAGVFDDVGR
jgi:hypothetical protein